jgi:hypothetical protein
MSTELSFYELRQDYQPRPAGTGIHIRQVQHRLTILPLRTARRSFDQMPAGAGSGYDDAAAVHGKDCVTRAGPNQPARLTIEAASSAHRVPPPYCVYRADCAKPLLRLEGR